jgi:2-keto-4-pentenoate hydratase/2-oxohepta-3-ene-1,7-dioic acid hydratase in catechol pathway
LPLGEASSVRWRLSSEALPIAVLECQTKDEIEDPHRLQVRLWNNGTLMQNFNTSDMAHQIPRCIESASALHPAKAGPAKKAQPDAKPKRKAAKG